MSDESIVRASELIKQSIRMVALTGAGISTPSGIPDFRSQKSGLWEHANPMEVASIQGFRYRPELFYEWIRPLMATMLAAKPNPAHLALAQLETKGILQSIITQNVDLLHSEAGSKVVYEVHGHIREATCIQCFEHYPARPVIEKLLESETLVVPLCPACGGVLKPNVVLFNEQLPARVLSKANQFVVNADVMLVVGSSLEIYPAADMPYQVKKRGGKVIIINFSKTEFDPMADIVIHGNAAEVLPRIVELLEGS
jgi:NAD-dependent deacetylase